MSWHRVLATDGAGLALTTPPVPLRLQRITASWPATGSTGTVRLAVDGATVAELDTTATDADAVLRLDRPELVQAAATITVAIPAAGIVELFAS